MTEKSATEPVSPPTQAGAAHEAAPALRPDAAVYRVLARKYRPINFDELIGQDALVRTLTNAIAQGRVAHAFVLTGVRGVGKTTTARIIARALNCIGPDGNGGPTAQPCGVCEHCRAIADDRHVDVIEMDAASQTGVDDVRAIIENARYKPISARAKIYIIDEVHMLSKNAFNALLKTLEEPPEHVKFIMATTEIRKVPVTVLSRCQRFDLKRLDQELLAKHLGNIAGKEGAKLTEPALALLARAADGSVRDGLSLLDQVIAQLGATAKRVDVAEIRAMLGLADRARVLDLLDLLMKGEVKASLDVAGELYHSGADPIIIVQDLLDVTHWLTRLKLVPEAAEGSAVSDAERARAMPMAKALPVAVLSRTWQMLLKGLSEVQTAPQPMTALEMLLVRLAYVSDQPTPGQLVDQLRNGQGVSSGGPAASTPGPSGNGARAMGGGGQAMAERSQPQSAPRAMAPPQPAPPPQPKTYADLVALFAAKREMIMHAHLINDVHLVRFEQGRIEFRPGPNAPANLANKLSELVTQWTGQRWLALVSRDAGEATLNQQHHAKQAATKADAAQHPLVRAVLDAFPGAVIESVREAHAPAADLPGAVDAGHEAPPPADSGDDILED
ncbi:MAG: DNA polymerase III subunit gamma/tau [Alphaproteobacteria bacterium]